MAIGIMIIEVIRHTWGATAVIKCDVCGLKFERPLSRSKRPSQFCCKQCTDEAWDLGILKKNKPFKEYTHKNPHCIVCDKPYDSSFYDKGDMGMAKINGGTRYVCNKDCYSAYADYWINVEKNELLNQLMMGV